VSEWARGWKEGERERDREKKVTESGERDVVAKCVAPRCGGWENW